MRHPCTQKPGRREGLESKGYFPRLAQLLLWVGLLRTVTFSGRIRILLWLEIDTSEATKVH